MLRRRIVVYIFRVLFTPWKKGKHGSIRQGGHSILSQVLVRLLVSTYCLRYPDVFSVPIALRGGERLMSSYEITDGETVSIQPMLW